MLVRSRMTRDVVTVAPTTTVAMALEVLETHNIRHLPVLDGTRLVGILSDRDLRLALSGGHPEDTVVTQVMNSEPRTVGATTTVEAAARILTDHRVGCVPVLDGGDLVGILTGSDLLRAFVELLTGRERHARLELLAPDRPGELARVVRLVGIEHGINITGVVVPPPRGEHALVVLHLEADDPTPLVEDLRRLGYEAASPALATRPD